MDNSCPDSQEEQHQQRRLNQEHLKHQKMHICSYKNRPGCGDLQHSTSCVFLPKNISSLKKQGSLLSISFKNTFCHVTSWDSCFNTVLASTTWHRPNYFRMHSSSHVAALHIFFLAPCTFLLQTHPVLSISEEVEHMGSQYFFPTQKKNNYLILFSQCLVSASGTNELGGTVRFL